MLLLNKHIRYRLWRLWRWVVTSLEDDPALTPEENAADRCAW